MLKVILVNIWGTWCPPCHEEIPYLIEFQNTYRKHGFEIIGIDFEGQTLQDDDELNAALKEFAEERGVNYRMALGGAGIEPDELFPEIKNFLGFPTNVYIDKKGKVRYITSGFLKGDVKNMKKKIVKLLAE